MGRRSTRHDAIPRFRARRQKSGNVHYYYDLGGKPRREEPLGTDYGLAIQKWAALERTRTAADVVRQVITFKYVAEEYRKGIVPTKAPQTQRDNMKELANLLEFFNDPPVPLDKIKPIHIRQFMTWRTKPRVRLTKAGVPMKSHGTGKVRANREKALFSHIWNFARDKGYTDLANPCAGIKGAKERAREVYVDDAEFAMLRAAVDVAVQDALDMAYLTGQRPSDTLSMDERHVRDGAIEVKQGKTGKKLRIEIAGELAALMARITERKRTYKVRATRLIVDIDGQPLTKGMLRYRFDKAREETGLTFQFRDLRAKAGTDKTDSSGDIRQAQKQLGHSTLAMTEDYIRQRRGDKVKPTK